LLEYRNLSMTAEQVISQEDNVLGENESSEEKADLGGSGEGRA
jgi:hypothetical protein